MNTSPSVQCDIPADWTANFSQCLYEWQGIEAGLLALIAALIGAFYLRRQISQHEKLETERLDRQHNAVRTTLPLTLSGLCESLRLMLVALDAAKRDVIANGLTTNFEPPRTPVEHVRELHAVVASTSDNSVVKPIANIIRELQTLWARVSLLKNPDEQKSRAGLKEEINRWIIQTAQTYALVESLFDYARAEAESGPTAVSWERAESIIFFLRIEDKDLVDIIKDALKRSTDFWTLK